MPSFYSTEFKYTPYHFLAGLNLPIYITTNYDFLMEALKDFGKDPVSEFFIWNDHLKDYIKNLDSPSTLKKHINPH